MNFLLFHLQDQEQYWYYCSQIIQIGLTIYSASVVVFCGWK